MILHRLRSGKVRYEISDAQETKLLRLYSKWQETRDVTLRKKVFMSLAALARRMPDYDLRRPFQNAF
ncbi:MAG: hypothetical protein A3G33_10245 [Omnitrophica bacterium RIFCSPLOWO2_12_FULL_44_17]|uniref:Uncharacterized protein n=1 Tax=Candidatus Danuiimicrobium aquiferis TaxID=1801832 RepID=A0A1G1L249_9BACT|nr:MAG: hypothetical protein A3B72_08365 [Omnitrophica bacterium RIFCSPHIGHO2_02_FULL_45_28]OGW91271.1 MAG: hypothetical protein A3E74_09875 [Omnitrophica bacterium RIFCSPHIGHO2_12_FULL_44_12]OGW99198.1 MAG: hypothetical protein A3G33_10245 [Omnitrophica bacterium RIFCSPLOWO2_12_FULL_44_17]OGX04386.1 MAG: hypothetical protein A3J12_00365 [Omnitrophica bacterium RIFCSPLOWO2_02_FULL_44_11]